jgi:hypothetical protein
MLGQCIIFSLFAATAWSSSSGQPDKPACFACNPSGVKTTVSPIIGKDDLGRFYESLLRSVDGIHFSKSRLSRRARDAAAPICCE